MSILTTLLDNPFIQTLIVGGIGWGVRKVLGKRADTKAGRATASIATAAAWMAQYVMTEPNKTPAQAIVAFKGFVARAFADNKFTEADRLKYQPLIDVAISHAVTEWVKRHPAPETLTMPATAKLQTALL